MSLEHSAIETMEMTCFACPEQWEGTLKDGQNFYFRYRNGVAMLGLGTTRGEAISVAGDNGVWIEHGDPLQGAFDTDDDRNRVFSDLFKKATAPEEDEDALLIRDLFAALGALDFVARDEERRQ